MLIKHPRDKLGWEWAYHGEVPANAIACEDTHLGGSNNCYLGVSMYSDGICKEAIGKIEAEEGMIHMSVNRESHICPFFLYLTLAPGVDGPRQRVWLYFTYSMRQIFAIHATTSSAKKDYNNCEYKLYIIF